MLETQIVPVTFAQGLDTKTDEKLVVPGKLTILENGVFSVGQKIKKRNGYGSFSRNIVGGGTIVAGDGLVSFDNELCVFSNNRMYSYSQSNNAWLDKGACYSLEVGKKNIIRNAFQQANPDQAINSNVAVYAWEDSRGGVRSSVIDLATGAPIQADAGLSATGRNPRCISVGGSIFVLYNETTTLFARRLDPGNPTVFGSAIVVGADLSASEPWYDISVSGLKAVIVYGSASDMRMKYFTQYGVVGGSAIGLPNPLTIVEDPLNSLAVCVDPTTADIWVYWHNGTELRYKIYYNDFTVKRATTTIEVISTAVLRITAFASSPASQDLFYEVNATATYNHYIKRTAVTSLGVVTTPKTLARSVALYSKVFQIGSQLFIAGIYDSVLQSTIFIFDMTGKIVAKILSTQAGGIRTARTAANVTVLNSTMAYLASSVKNKFVSENGTTFTVSGCASSTIDFNSDKKYIAVKLGENLHIGGGVVNAYDGQSVTELGFHLFPENVVATPASSGGHIADGTYLVYVVWEWIDNRGQVHRSAPSVPASVTISGGSGNGSYALAIPTLRLTDKTGSRINVVASVYRTLINGTVAYKVGNNGLSPTANPVFNNPTTDSISFIDTSADATISGNEILYTTGGVLDNIAAPACMAISTYKSRLVAIPSENPLVFWYSKIKFNGEGTSFSDSLFKDVNPVGGDLTGVQFMDDKLLLFKTNFVFVTAGDGALDTGEQDQLLVPEIVPSDVGCPNPRSIVLTPIGTMFKSNKGIYLIDRSLSVKYMGADVERYNAQSVVASTLVETKNQVRFLTDLGLTLCYDYYFAQWSTFTNHEGVGSDHWQGKYVYLRTDGTVYNETDSVFRDDNLEYRLRIGTAWLKFAGIQGYQRIRRFALLGNYGSPHLLRCKVGYDYQSTYSDAIIFNAGEVLDFNNYGDDALYGESAVYGSVSDNVYQFRGHLATQKCESIRFLFEDLTTGTPGESYSLSDLSLEVGIKRGLNKMRSQKTIG
jgi:3D (Asp-Asp-Asp) domain-containing protein